MKLAALVIESSDGPEYIRVLLYPSDWSGRFAEDKARDIIESISAENEEYTWEECEDKLEAEGFTVPCWRTADFFWDAI